jgi:DNA-binding MarR family transcriptional regulator/GNAT superfamily N-acetyltransferase
MKPQPEIDAVRSFNRFYTRQIGVLREGLLRSSYSLTQVRVLYEIAQRKNCTASKLCQELGLDPGYLSRLLHIFITRKLVHKTTSSKDSRQSLLRLTAAGQRSFNKLNARQNQEVTQQLRKLSSGQQRQLVAAMRTVRQLLEPEKNTPYTLRSHRPGDLGWVVHRHGALYSEEENYNEKFEGLVATIVGDFVANFDSAHERCWFAEKDGEIAGFIFLVKKSAAVCKLRLLLVEPWARGLGIGRRLIAECVQFAREANYKKIMLWTQGDLLPARRLYKHAGFRVVKEEPHSSWGRHGMVSETWELKL